MAKEFGAAIVAFNTEEDEECIKLYLTSENHKFLGLLAKALSLPYDNGSFPNEIEITIPKTAEPAQDK